MTRMYQFTHIPLVLALAVFGATACDKNESSPGIAPDSGNAPINQQAPGAPQQMQQGAAPMQQAPMAMDVDISDEQLREYVKVSIQAGALQQQAQQQIQAAQQSGNQEMAQQVMQQVQGQMQAIVQQSELSDQELNMIGQQVQQDPELQQEAQEIAQEIMQDLQQQQAGAGAVPPGQ